MAVTRGTSSGDSSKMADSGSMKQPTTSSSTLMHSSRLQLGRFRPVSQAVIAAGTWLTVSSQPNTLAQATMIRIWPVNTAVVAALARMSRQDSSRYTYLATAIAYTQATAAASVGVNTPP